MRKLKIAEAAKIAGVSPHQMRIMIQNGQIKGASYHGELPRRTYYITDEQLKNQMKGAWDEG